MIIELITPVEDHQYRIRAWSAGESTHYAIQSRVRAILSDRDQDIMVVAMRIMQIEHVTEAEVLLQDSKNGVRFRHD